MKSQEVCLHARITNKKYYNQTEIENALFEVLNANSVPRTGKLMKVVVNGKLKI